MKLIEVNDSSTSRKFLRMPLDIYKNEKFWIRPLDKDIEQVFDQNKNKYFRNGECIRWILEDESGRVIGRIAAFHGKNFAKGNDQPTGGLGFFECINNKEASAMLFDAAIDWLKSKGMEAVDGPVNFGDRDKWWGLLVDGFDKEPNYSSNYQLPYYRELFESYGFQNYFEQYTFGREIDGPVSDRLHEKAMRIRANPNYTFRHLETSKIDEYTEYFRVIYNKAWARHVGVSQMNESMAKHIMKQMKPILDPKIVWFGFYNGEPVAFFIILPEINQIIKYLDGNLNWYGKLKFLYHKWRGTCRKVLGIVFGIVPEHQGKGVEGGLIYAFKDQAQRDYRRYDYMEMNWVGDFNPSMVHVLKQVGARAVKTHITYRMLFDPEKPFKRHPVLH